METHRNQRSRDRSPLIFFGVFLALVAVAVTLGIVFRPVGYYPWYPFGFGWIFIPFGFFFLFFVLRWFFWPWEWGYEGGYRMRDESYSILRKRFARGEITKEQFEQMTRDLEHHGGRQ